MNKYRNRLKARLARAALKECTGWVLTKDLILETDEGDVAFDAGEVVEVGATTDGDVAIKGPAAALVVISDEDLATKIADLLVSSDELSDVKFVEKNALDAVLDGVEIEDVIDELAGDPVVDGEKDAVENNNTLDGETVEVAEVDVEKKESVLSKFEKFAKRLFEAKTMLKCNAIKIEEGADRAINLKSIKHNKSTKELVESYAEFTKKVSAVKGSLQPGKREIALAESGKVMGAFNKDTNQGILFVEETFETVEDLDNFDDTPVGLIPSNEAFDDEMFANIDPLEDNDEVNKLNDKFLIDDDFDDEMDVKNYLDSYSMSGIEECLKTYEESAKTGKDYMKLLEGLNASKVKLKEGAIAKIVSAYDKQNLTECVKVFDTKLGKYVAVFESKNAVDADNFIAETNEAKRFTKRFFA